MSWKLRRNANNASPTGVLILCCVVCFIFFPKVTIGLILIFLILQFWDVIFDERFKGGNHNPINNPENIKSIYKQQKKSKESPNIKDYPGSPQYQALLKKYNGNIPGAGQGDRSKGKKPKGRNLGWRYGTKGGKYNERISKKGNRYRQYF